MRRAWLAPLVLAVALATSGCLGVVLGDPLAYEAQPAGIDEGARSQNGVVHLNQSTFTVRHEPDLPLLGTREVRIVSHVSVYAFVGDGPLPGDSARTVDGNVSAVGGNAATIDGDATATPSAGTLIVVSTPRAEYLGQGLNPLGRLPTRELVEQVGGRTGEQNGVAYVGETTVTVLGTGTAVEKYRSTTTAGNVSVETFVYVARVEHDGDYLIAVAVLPRDLADREPALYAAIAGIRHPVEAPGGGPRRGSPAPEAAGTEAVTGAD